MKGLPMSVVAAWRGLRRPALFGGLALLPFLAGATAGETPATAPPSFWDSNRTLEKPDLSGVRQIRFLTEDDFPPFNFLSADGQVAGFNVDLARAICAELDVPCTIQRRSWELLIPSLDDNSGDAIIASLAINYETRKQVDFTAPYFLTPGRFAMRTDTTLKSASPDAIGDRPVAVVGGSRHEAFLKAFYPKATLVPFETPALARNALKAGRVQAHFGDAVTLSYWLNGAEAGGCCEFRDGPFTDPRFFGEGVGIAVKKGNNQLRRALDYALAKLARRGVFGEIYLKYFPVGPF
ncbi:transporter substrate-binding domain-containing protein [Methylocystis sp. WRRC1]|uniref:transporter substrate-binding domain-containing protein n=1 Tax=Methylocystis sp. WRRC1 TaxID=1732014 RepID=UPI001D13E08F|nr:transporter substrate-binding domain-containing protein [Methylocystis sp. WRRC1]